MFNSQYSLSVRTTNPDHAAVGQSWSNDVTVELHHNHWGNFPRLLQHFCIAANRAIVHLLYAASYSDICRRVSYLELIQIFDFIWYYLIQQEVSNNPC